MYRINNNGVIEEIAVGKRYGNIVEVYQAHSYKSGDGVKYVNENEIYNSEQQTVNVKTAMMLEKGI